MSVYYEALHSGRLDGLAWAPVEQPKRHGFPGVRKSCKGIRRALREAKRLEAEERNERRREAVDA